jgi:hypothetical protein
MSAGHVSPVRRADVFRHGSSEKLLVTAQLDALHPFENGAGHRIVFGFGEKTSDT